VDRSAVPALTPENSFFLKGSYKLGYGRMAYAHISRRLSQAGCFSGSGYLTFQVTEKPLLLLC
jgi:hypothetical protein